VDNFVDKHCEDELSPRQALSSIGHILRSKAIFLFNFNGLSEKFEPFKPAFAGKPHE
jgi:hypothetical protein